MIGQICHVVFLSSHGSISFILLAAIGEVVVPIVHLPVQSVYITTNVVSSNPAHGQVYLIQQYVIKFVRILQPVGSFLQVLRIPLLIKLTATI